MSTNYPQDNDSLRGKDESNYQRKFQHLGILGCGAFGVVFRAKNIFDKQEYAVKRIQLKSEPEPESTNREWELLAQFSQCHHIVGYHCVWFDTVDLFDQSKLDAKMQIYNLTQTGPLVHFCYIQMELCRESLEDWLTNKTDRDKVESLKIFTRVMKGLSFLHGKEVVHRDLKPSNILFAKTNEDLRVRIADFGLSRQVEGSTATAAGTRLYMAPETFRGKCYFKSDIYSAALILLELLYKCSDDQKIDILQNARDKQFPTHFENTMKFAVSTLKQMLSSDKSDRPSSDDLLHLLKNNPDWQNEDLRSAAGRLHSLEKEELQFATASLSLNEELQSRAGRPQVEHPSEEKDSNWEDFSSKEEWKFTSECSSEQHSLQRVGRFTAVTSLSWDGKEASSWTALPTAAFTNTRWDVMLLPQPNDDFELGVRCTLLDEQFRAAAVRVVAVVEGAPQLWGEEAAVVQPYNNWGLLFSKKLKECPIVRPIKVRVTAQWTELEKFTPTPDLWMDSAARIHCSWKLTGWKVVTPTADSWNLWSEPFGRSGALWRIRVVNSRNRGKRELKIWVLLQHLSASVEWSGLRWKCSLSVWRGNVIEEKNMEQDSYCARLCVPDVEKDTRTSLDVVVIIDVSRKR